MGRICNTVKQAVPGPCFFAHPLRVLNEFPDPPKATSARPRKLGLRPQTCAFKLPDAKCMELCSSRIYVHPNRSLFLERTSGMSSLLDSPCRDAALGLDGCPNNFIGLLRGSAGFGYGKVYSHCFFRFKSPCENLGRRPSPRVKHFGCLSPKGEFPKCTEDDRACSKGVFSGVPFFGALHSTAKCNTRRRNFDRCLIA